MSFVIKNRLALFVLFSVGAAVLWPGSGWAHVENADLFDFGNDNQWRQYVGGPASQPDAMRTFEKTGWTDAPGHSLAADAVGCFGSIAGFERPMSLWRKISGWIASRIGADGDNRGLAADSFNGVYVTMIGEGADASGSLVVNGSASAGYTFSTNWPDFSDFKLEIGAARGSFDDVVFLGHRSGLVAGTSVDQSELDAELAAHFCEVVSNVR